MHIYIWIVWQVSFSVTQSIPLSSLDNWWNVDFLYEKLLNTLKHNLEDSPMVHIRHFFKEISYLAVSKKYHLIETWEYCRKGEHNL